MPIYYPRLLANENRVIIHTANILAEDWNNMSQGVWQSPLLPLLPTRQAPESEKAHLFGTGSRFKRDLLAYLDYYGRRKTWSLVDQLHRFDFQAVRACLVASVPSKVNINNGDSARGTLWGWPALKDALRQIPVNKNAQSTCSHIVIQVGFTILKANESEIDTVRSRQLLL